MWHWNNDAENSALRDRNKIHLKYIHIKLYSVVYCTFDQINAALVSKSYFFQKHKKILPRLFVTAKYKMFHLNFSLSYKK